MKIAITGASGKLGSAIIDATLALEGDNQVIGIARNPGRVTRDGVEARQGDYSDRASYDEALRGVDVLLLLSGMDAPDKRVGQHRNVIEAARQQAVRKIVYTSVQGSESGTAFSPIVQSNRQTEQDVRDSGLQWAIGRNGIYIEPDIESLDDYRQAGEIANCAADGKCGYTTRAELGYAYARLLTDDRHNGQSFNLHGEAITQQQLAEYLNLAFGTSLVYRPMGVEEYLADRIAANGEFIGTVIAGIYQGIREGKADNPSHFENAAGRAHQAWQDYFEQLR